MGNKKTVLWCLGVLVLCCAIALAVRMVKGFERFD
jgi:hypothetical protein